MNKVLLSKRKLDELKLEIANLEEAVQKDQEYQLQRGGAMDSFHETASHAATEKAKEKKLSELKDIMTSAEILPDVVKSEDVVIGSRIELIPEEGKHLEFRLVHPLESDSTQQLISTESPLGQKLLGKKTDASITHNNQKFTINIL